MNINAMNKTELLFKCNELGIKKYSCKNKSELIELINDKINEIKPIIDTNTLLNCEVNVNINLIFILNKLLEKYNIKKLSEILNLSSGTITRWIELNNIPKSYEFDLLKLSNIKIDYSKYSSKEKDQFLQE